MNGWLNVSAQAMPGGRKPIPAGRGQLAPAYAPLTSICGIDLCEDVKGEPMLWTFIAFLLVLWLVGWGLHVGGNLIHILLVLAFVFGIANLLLGRRTM
jgi:hypothetical protein